MHATDIFYSKFLHNPTNEKLDEDYRKTILEKGGAQDPMQSIIQFLDREPSALAFNEFSLGLKAE